MKRILAMEPTTLVEHFGNWARDTGHDAYWGISVDGDGRQVLLLHGDVHEAAGYRVALTTGTSGDAVYIVAGYELHGAEAAEGQIGTLQESPGVMISRSISWLLDLARDYHELELDSVSATLATAGQDIAARMGDLDAARECYDFLGELGRR